jgi:hypothetical protein
MSLKKDVADHFISSTGVYIKFKDVAGTSKGANVFFVKLKGDAVEKQLSRDDFNQFVALEKEWSENKEESTNV